MLILIVLLPLLGFFSGSLFGRFIGWGSCYITTGSVFLSLIFSLILFFDVTSSGVVYKLTMGNWIAVDSLNIDWSFCFDSLTSVMLIVVTFISTLVHLYSTEYMEYDPHLPRFMSYLSLFTFFMLILITANNFLQMFVGWEGVGLSSYLLINFWFTRIQANKAAIKAMLVNRIGDFSLLLAIFAIYFVFNSLDYDTVFSLAPLMLDYKILIGGMKMSESEEKTQVLENPTSKAEIKKNQSITKKPRTSAYFWLLLALPALFAVIAVSWFGWQQWQIMLTDLERIEYLNVELEAHLKQANSQSIITSNRELEHLENRKELSQQVINLQLQVNAQGARITELGSTTRTDWYLSEAAYLARLASQRLQTERGTKNPLALLQKVDSILAS